MYEKKKNDTLTLCTSIKVQFTALAACPITFYHGPKCGSIYLEFDN